MDLKEKISLEISRISRNLGLDGLFLYSFSNPIGEVESAEKKAILFLFPSYLNRPSPIIQEKDGIPLVLNAEDGMIQSILKSETPFSGEIDQFGKEFSKFPFHYVLASALNSGVSFSSRKQGNESFGVVIGCQNIKPGREQVKQFAFELSTLSLLLSLLNAEFEVGNLQSANSTLEKKLETAYQRLLESDKLAGIGRFAGGLAHELNTPLGAIQTYTEFLQLYLKNGSEKEAVEGILKSVHHCKEIIENVLSLSKDQKRPYALVSLKKVVDDALLLTHFELEKSKIALKLEIEEALPQIKGDHTKLVQVVSNLLSNSAAAIQHRKLIPKKGIIEIKLRSENFSPGKTENSFVVLMVSDNGSGVPSSLLGKIFDPFFTTKEVGKGTGLGLSISQAIIEEHQGSIELFSTEGKGTTVSIRFPEYKGGI
ncbi:MAG: ATP-binding protein [Candidatus Eremiobacteraeota bacterium]|nr:ATP-binding protein [Candidatus Eremiobacteraeota bacterium]MCL5054880.1 ATP-binding protein [Bacillota bacterium]